jgi:trans-2,3-dihydro-3-hydroxyanthranilate isomerase
MPHLYPYDQIDVFSLDGRDGNPCAVVDERGLPLLTNAARQAIAAQSGFSEAVFIGEAQGADFGLRIFSPGQEMDFAGHPVIAAAFSLDDRGQGARDKREISFELRDGSCVAAALARDASGAPLFWMTQKPPVFGARCDAAEAAAMLGLEAGALLPGLQPQVVSTGLPALMIPLASIEVLRRAAFQEEAFARFRAAAAPGCFCVHAFCLEGFTPQGQAAARNFAPAADGGEDPFTGSSWGAAVCYAAEGGLLESDAWRVEQGHPMGRPGFGLLRIERDAKGKLRAPRIGGEARRVIRKTLAF